MDYTIFIQPAFSIVVALISGILSYLASRANNKTELKKQAREHKHDIEKLENNFKYEMESLQQQHKFELERLNQTHELLLKKLEKTSQLDVETDQGLKLNDLIYRCFTGEVDMDHALALQHKVQSKNHKEMLQNQFIQKTSQKKS